MDAWTRLCEDVGSLLEPAQVPGAAIGLLHGDEEHYAAFGLANVETGLAVAPETLFQTGSVTKTFTGTVAMILRERGELDLDAPVRRYLPELRVADDDAAARATMRHLLTHTAGWVGDYFADYGTGDDALARMVAALTRLEQLTPLGEVWSYNNAAFYIAGRVLEKITGTTYEEAVRDLVLEPLGMDSSFFFADDVMTRRFSVGHIAKPDSIEVARPWAVGRSAHPAGGIVSNVEDMLRYARFHLGLADGPLPAAARQEMQEVQAEAGSVADYIGLTWFLSDVGGTRIVGHGGTTLGQNAWFELMPDRSYAFVVFANSTRGGEVTRHATRLARAAFAGVTREDPAHTVRTAHELAEYAGSYEAALSVTHLTLGDDALVLRLEPLGGFPEPGSPPRPAPPPSRLAFTSSDTVVGLDDQLAGLRGEFLRGADGAIEWFRFGGRIARRA